MPQIQYVGIRAVMKHGCHSTALTFWLAQQHVSLLATNASIRAGEKNTRAPMTYHC